MGEWRKREPNIITPHVDYDDDDYDEDSDDCDDYEDDDDDENSDDDDNDDINNNNNNIKVLSHGSLNIFRWWAHAWWLLLFI